jgi:hypothetical protein
MAAAASNVFQGAVIDLLGIGSIVAGQQPEPRQGDLPGFFPV